MTKDKAEEKLGLLMSKLYLLKIMLGSLGRNQSIEEEKDGKDSRFDQNRGNINLSTVSQIQPTGHFSGKSDLLQPY